MIGSYSELFLHTDKKHSFLLLETNKCRKAFTFWLCICHVCSQLIFTKILEFAQMETIFLVKLNYNPT